MARVNEVHIKGVPAIAQHNSSTCWFASFQMVYQWKGRNRAEVKKRISSAQTNQQRDAEPPIADFGYMSAHGIGKADLVPCAKALRMEWGGGESKKIGIAALLYVLDTCGPIWIAGRWNSGNHVIVLTGARRSKTDMVIYRNPWTQYGGGKENNKPLRWLNDGRGPWKQWLGSIMHCGRYRKRKFSDYED